MYVKILTTLKKKKEWSCDSVAKWLAINDLAVYIDSFLDKTIDGEKLLNIDSAKLKVSC